MPESSKKLSKKERAEIQRKIHEEKKQKKEAERQQYAAQKELNKKFRTNIVTGWIFVIFGLAALMASGIFLFSKFFGTQILASLLPQETTIAFFEMDLKRAHSFSTQLQSFPAYSAENLKSFFSEKTSFNFDEEIQPWLGKKIGVAFLRNNESVNQLFFLETKSKKKTLATLQELKLPNGTDTLIEERRGKFRLYTFSLSQNFYFTFLDHYAVFSQKADDLVRFLESSSDRGNLLLNNDWYRKSKTHLPISGLIRGYIDIQSLAPSLGTSLSLLQPFLELFPSMGFTVNQEGSNLVAQSYLNIDKNLLTSNEFFRYPLKYRGDLLSLFERDDLIYLFGGRDLPKFFERLRGIVNELDPSASLILEGILRQKKNEYFGKNISLEDDIYALFQGEYALSLEPLKLIAEIGEENRATILRLKEAFENSSLHYAFLNDLFILSKEKTSVEKSIDLALETGEQSHRENVELVIGAADTVSLWYIPLVSDRIPSSARPFFTPFEFLASGTNIFEDGISTLYQLKIFDE